VIASGSAAPDRAVQRVARFGAVQTSRVAIRSRNLHEYDGFTHKTTLLFEIHDLAVGQVDDRLDSNVQRGVQDPRNARSSGSTAVVASGAAMSPASVSPARRGVPVGAFGRHAQAASPALGATRAGEVLNDRHDHVGARADPGASARRCSAWSLRIGGARRSSRAPPSPARPSRCRRPTDRARRRSATSNQSLRVSNSSVVTLAQCEQLRGFSGVALGLTVGHRKSNATLIAPLRSCVCGVAAKRVAPVFQAEVVRQHAGETSTRPVPETRFEIVLDTVLPHGPSTSSKTETALLPT